MHLPPPGSYFMAMESHKKGSLVVLFTECFSIKGQLSLNFFFGHLLLSLCYITCKKKNTLALLICFSTGSSHVYNPVCISLSPFIFFFASYSLSSIQQHRGSWKFLFSTSFIIQKKNKEKSQVGSKVRLATYRLSIFHGALPFPLL